MANAMARLYTYAERTFDLGHRLSCVGDGRQRPKHTLSSLLLKTIGGIVTGLGSFNQLEERIRQGDFDRLGGSNRPSADTFGYALARLDEVSLSSVASQIARQARDNKALDATRIDGFRVAAVDGTGVFSTVSERLGGDAHYRRDAHGDETATKQYSEHALAISYVGGNQAPKPLLSLTRIPKGDGETTEARKCIKALVRRQGRFCDVLTFDALFAGAPTLNCVLACRLDFVVRVKQERYRIIRDADGLFAQRPPDLRYTDVKLRGAKGVRYDLEIWEDEQFTSWESVMQPLRCLKVRETRKRRNAAGELVDIQQVTTHFVTSAAQDKMPALTVWKIAHYRWDLENTGFHVLKHHFGLDHAYSYDPPVIQAMYDLYVIAYNLFQFFVYRNLRRFDPKRDTLRGVMLDLFAGLVTLTAPLMPMKRALRLS